MTLNKNIIYNDQFLEKYGLDAYLSLPLSNESLKLSDEFIETFDEII